LLRLLFWTLVLCPLATSSAAKVMCAKRSGMVFARDRCRKHESALDLSQFGAVGSPGPTGPPGPPGVGPIAQCPPDSTLVGATCVDLFEASVWDVPAANTALIDEVKKGNATALDLINGGAHQVSASPACTPIFPVDFPPSGDWTHPLYAVSLPAVSPAGCVTWFQAAQACALAGKRLLTNAEWQQAAAGTPDPGNLDDLTTTCATKSSPALTGARTGCKSIHGTFDMVGNLWEWVADWTAFPHGCTGSWGAFSDDFMCLAGVTDPPTGTFALYRGGNYGDGALAGKFAVLGSAPFQVPGNDVGFRCAR
jgi:hypothetical protein